LKSQKCFDCSLKNKVNVLFIIETLSFPVWKRVARQHRSTDGDAVSNRLLHVSFKVDELNQANYDETAA